MTDTDVEAEEDVATVIANALWERECEQYITCKTNELEPAAEFILEYLWNRGFQIIWEKTGEVCAPRSQYTAEELE